MATLETQQLDDIIVNSRRKMLSLGTTALAGLVFAGAAKRAEAQTAITITTSSTSPSISNTLRRTSITLPSTASPSTSSPRRSASPAREHKAWSSPNQTSPRSPSPARRSKPTRLKPPSKKASTSPSFGELWVPRSSPAPDRSRQLLQRARNGCWDWLRSTPSPATPTSSSARISSRM